MASVGARVASWAIATGVRRADWGNERELVRRARRLFGAPAWYSTLASYGVRRTPVDKSQTRGEWLVPKSPRGGVIFYVHGGGFVSCSSTTHRPVTAELARLTQRVVFSADYRLAPEHRLPAAHADVSAAYQWARRQVPDQPFVLVGDSAGGNLVLSLALDVRGSAQAPTGVVAFSPWTDLSGRGDSVRSNDGRCAMFRTSNIESFAAVAVGAGDRSSPAHSPAYARLDGLPPLLLHVGSTELLLDDSRIVHDRATAGGTSSTLEIYDDVPHGWQMLTPWVPEARASLASAASFIEARLSASGRPRETEKGSLPLSSRGAT